MKGDSEFELFFAAWFETPSTARRPLKDFERTLEEDDLVVALRPRRRSASCGDGRRLQRSVANCSMQEYPCTIDEAFIASGRPVFDPEQACRVEEPFPEPVKYRMDVIETPAGWTLEDNSAGRLLGSTATSTRAKTYCIGADVGMGVRDGDWSVAHVLDSEKRQVAVFRGQVHPDFFATILNAMGFYYNTALIAPERNNHGILTCVKLWKDLSYPNVFIEFKEGQMEDRESVNIGHYTDVKTRPLIIDRCAPRMRDGTT
jgi:hypothetical protein